MPAVVKPAWLPDGLYQEWLTAFNEAGGVGVPNAANLATEVVRNSPSYDSYFPGLRREDGSLRYAYNPEATYYNNIESYKNAVESVGINPDVFNAEYINLIEGDTSPDEFMQRVNVTYDRLEMGGLNSDIRGWYADNFGIEMTNEGILASIMSPTIGQAVLDKRLTMAEIGGEAASRNFEISKAFVDLLEGEGMNRNEADKLFGSAERMVPVLSALAARHGDVDDDFDIKEYAGAAFLQDADQQRRMERLMAQEASVFTGGAQIDYLKARSGGVAGLEVR